MSQSAGFRLAVMFVLAAVLMVPMMMVYGMVEERAASRNEAVKTIAAGWGGSQRVSGPLLVVPYTQMRVDDQGSVQPARARAFILPRDLHFEAVVTTAYRARGIFRVAVYTTTIKFRGTFAVPDLSWIGDSPAAPSWDTAGVAVGISDPAALARRASVTLNGRNEAFVAGVEDAGLFSTGIHASAHALQGLAAGASVPFEFTLEVRGTEELTFVPTADDTTVTMTSSWPHPEFVGARLPETRAMSAGGFTAEWRVPDFGHPFPDHWTTADMNRHPLLAQADSSAFGVVMKQTVDTYQQVDRAVKYAFLFIVLTFLVFFLWEVFRPALLHPMQYCFVGVAICVFYLLLLSISERAGFDIAYFVSATVTTLLIAGYASAVLRGTRQGSSVGLSLSILYGMLFLLLRLEDYALMTGSIGLFLILAAVMFFTRRMNWYELRLGARPPASEG